MNIITFRTEFDLRGWLMRTMKRVEETAVDDGRAAE